MDFNDAYIEQHMVVEPTTFQGAYNHPDPFARDKWCNTTEKE